MNDLSTALGRVRNSLASNLGADGVLVLTKGDVAEVLALINQTANPQGEPVAWTEVDVLDFMSVALRHAEYSGLAPSDILEGLRYMMEKGRPEHYSDQPAPVAVLPERLQQVLKFLDGAENLDGHWFGEPGPTGSRLWWRAELRKAIAETNLFEKQQ